VKRLSEFKKTIWHTGEIKVGKTNLGAMAVVAAPIMDSKVIFLVSFMVKDPPPGMSVALLLSKAF
jgi:hypothetical protein